jgi:hypothetical protein
VGETSGRAGEVDRLSSTIVFSFSHVSNSLIIFLSIVADIIIAALCPRSARGALTAAHDYGALRHVRRRKLGQGKDDVRVDVRRASSNTVKYP